MFDYCKVILEKISFNKVLFQKEYHKSLKYLDPVERYQFKKWVSERFGDNVLRTEV